MWQKRTEKAAAAVGRPNCIQRYFSETIGELRKVTWPTRKEATNLTVDRYCRYRCYERFSWGSGLCLHQALRADLRLRCSELGIRARALHEKARK